MEDLAFIVTLLGWFIILLLVIFSKAWRSSRAFLALTVLWLFAKVLFVLHNGIVRELDITNPSLIGLIGFGSLVVFIALKVRAAKRGRDPQ